MPMSWFPPLKRPPIIPPIDEPVTPLVVPATPSNNDAAMAAIPTLRRRRWLIALTLQRLADLLELFRRDLASRESTPENVRGLVASPGIAESPNDNYRQRDDAAPEQDHHGRHPEPAPAVVVTPHHLGHPPWVCTPSVRVGCGSPSADGPQAGGPVEPKGYT